MGLSLSAISLLLEEAAIRPFHGTVGTLGKQHVAATSRQLHCAFRHAEVLPKKTARK